MSEAEYIEMIVRALKKVKPKSLLIIELANKVVREDGQLDRDELENLQPDVILASAEAKVYTAYTMAAVAALEKLPEKTEDV